MTAQTFSLIVILIAAPIWFMVVLARSKSDAPDVLWPVLLTTMVLIAFTLSVAWGIRLIVLNL